MFDFFSASQFYSSVVKNHANKTVTFLEIQNQMKQIYLHIFFKLYRLGIDLSQRELIVFDTMVCVFVLMPTISSYSRRVSNSLIAFPFYCLLRLFQLNLGPPKKLHELDPETWEYWKRLRKENIWRFNRLHKGKKF